MSAVCFTVPGDPRGKGRPRATSFGGHTRVYTDAKTATYENLVKLAAAEAMGTPPKSATKRHRVLMLNGTMRPAKKPDLTNIIKAVEDGANGVAYADDAQIVDLTAWKTYAETAGVDVTITELGVVE